MFRLIVAALCALSAVPSPAATQPASESWTVSGTTERSVAAFRDCFIASEEKAGRPFAYVLNGTGVTFSTVPVSGGLTERQVLLLKDFGARFIGATPSYALNIAEVADGMGVDLRKLPLRYGAFGAEPWSEAMRRDIEARFDIKAMDTYGLSEIIGPGVSCECIESKDGPHIWEDHFYPEVIDPATGKVLPDGEVGELGVDGRRQRGGAAERSSAVSASEP